MDDPPLTAGLIPRRGKARERAWEMPRCRRRAAGARGRRTIGDGELSKPEPRLNHGPPPSPRAIGRAYRHIRSSSIISTMLRDHGCVGPCPSASRRRLDRRVAGLLGHLVGVQPRDQIP